MHKASQRRDEHLCGPDALLCWYSFNLGLFESFKDVQSNKANRLIGTMDFPLAHQRQSSGDSRSNSCKLHLKSYFGVLSPSGGASWRIRFPVDTSHFSSFDRFDSWLLWKIAKHLHYATSTRPPQLSYEDPCPFVKVLGQNGSPLPPRAAPAATLVTRHRTLRTTLPAAARLQEFWQLRSCEGKGARTRNHIGWWSEIQDT